MVQRNKEQFKKEELPLPPAMETIQNRISVRTYDAAPVSGTLKARLQALFGENKAGPFGSPVRFRLLDLDTVSREELRRLGTYGIIKGARLFILGAVKERERCLEDLGYCMEKIILEATAVELGTCWLGGTFRRSSFAARMELAPDELLPAITPVGYPAEKISTTDRLFRYRAGSRRRKPWAELFFAADGKTPLAEEEAGRYREALEAVRLAPSASNRQPWRVLKDETGLYHLFLKEDRLYNRALGKIRIQEIDMGIAMCHFELVAVQQGSGGQWKQAAPAVILPGLEYICSWVPGEQDSRI